MVYIPNAFNGDQNSSKAKLKRHTSARFRQLRRSLRSRTTVGSSSNYATPAKSDTGTGGKKAAYYTETSVGRITSWPSVKQLELEDSEAELTYMSKITRTDESPQRIQTIDSENICNQLCKRIKRLRITSIDSDSDLEETEDYESVTQLGQNTDDTETMVAHKHSLTLVPMGRLLNDGYTGQGFLTGSNNKYRLLQVPRGRLDSQNFYDFEQNEAVAMNEQEPVTQMETNFHDTENTMMY